MNHLSVLLAAGLITAGTVANAVPVDVSKLPPPSKEQGVTYEKDIHPLFEASCIRCHGQEKPKAGLRLDSLAGVLKGSKDGKVVKVGESEKSQLVIAVSQLDPESAMPPKPRRGKRGPGGPGGGPGSTNAPAGAPAPHGEPGGPGDHGGEHGGSGAPGGHPMGPPPKPLTAEQVGLVRAWIDQGAK
jgi:hypothetical protein